MGWLGDLWNDITGVTAAEEASEAMTSSTEAAIEESRMNVEEQRRQFDLMQQLLSPYTEAGTGALQQQQALTGALGEKAQKDAIAGIQNSPSYQAALQSGETSILQNAAATGGVRGGRTQAALGQYAPQLLGQAIDQRYSQLGGLSQLGQASAAGVGAAGLGVGQNQQIGGLLQNLGQQQASNILGQYNLQKNFLGDALGLGLKVGGLFI